MADAAPALQRVPATSTLMAVPSRAKVALGESAYARWAGRLFAKPVGGEIYELAETLHVRANHTPPVTRVARLQWLFQHAERFAGLPGARIGQAVWYLASEEYGELGVLRHDRVKRETRERTALAIALLFENLLARVCRPELSHLAKKDEPSDWANMACYMFWDICPIGPRFRDLDVGEPRTGALDAACLTAMEKTLAIPHLACQEGALHGLGHWRRDYPERVDAIVDAFLARSRRLPKELVAYAKEARTGQVV
jgi:hypothetical protein